MAEARKKECHRCGRQFARLEHLQRHERSHTKEKPFACSVCLKAFTRKDLLTRHTRIYHPPDVPPVDEIDAHQDPTSARSHTLYTSASSHIANTNDGSGLIQSGEPSGFLPASGSHQRESVPGIAIETFGNVRDINHNEIWSIGPNFSDFPTTYSADEFSNFVDSIGFPSNVFSPSYQPVPDWPSEPSPAVRDQVLGSYGVQQNPTYIATDALGTEETPWASRMPSVQPHSQPTDTSREAEESRPKILTQVSHQCRENMVEKLKPFSSLIPENFKLPSRHTLTCFITGFVTIFSEHYPLLHIPTLKLDSLSVELFLSIAALGAQYYWERSKGFELFNVARAITYDRLRGQFVQNVQSPLASEVLLQAAQALILLIAVSTWSETGKGDAFALRSLLEEVLQAEALDAKKPADTGSWIDWKCYEELKRTKLIAFAFFNLHTITFDVPPMTLYRDIQVNLACSDKLWRADNAETWRKAREEEPEEISFGDAFHYLFQDSAQRSGINSVSPLSGHVLMHAIIQHIWLLQQAGNLPIRKTLASTTAANSVEQALKRWRKCCELNHEPSSVASNPDGPIPFTSRALLRLAYIRLNIDSGSARCISCWDPVKIAESLRRQEPIQRSNKMTKAALHCAQGLGIPIKLGINFVAHTQVFYWSNQYVLCSLECALLLTKWLEAVTEPTISGQLTDQETKLLDFVVQLVNHTEFEAPRRILLQNNNHLSVIVLRLWAKLFRPDSVWEIVDLIGKALQAYADLLEQDANQQATSTEIRQ